jgi:hypothetical protein
VDEPGSQGLDLAPQFYDMDPQCVQFAIIALVPDLLEDPRPGEAPPGVAHEVNGP